ncbi:sulfite exporter TauE/SafE family protein [Schaalia sp. lx-260]|uniref:sulfite exporter TauE/SafE family protein n=1 Tax=Schaalia sp. lx-260 TaxID=2899082 RepID=UPI001E55A444|nr:sulfite exporter TauE/SafE family protein [Schaalia sp. lx-260]
MVLKDHVGTRKIPAIVGIGIISGLLAGLFGVGGGLIIVPALRSLLRMEQRRAAASSLCAIILTASVGACVYAAHGQLSLLATLCVAGGALAGSQVGAFLLRTLPERILPWIFVAFIMLIIFVSHVHIPTREADIVFTVWNIIAMILVGFVSGIFAGLVGVGGGGIIVPGLEFVVGAGDLIARGTSLLVMVPTSVAGTFTHARHGLVDVPTGLIIGMSAALFTPCGAWIAGYVSPKVNSILLSIFLASIIISTVYKTWAQLRRAK